MTALTPAVAAAFVTMVVACGDSERDPEPAPGLGSIDWPLASIAPDPSSIVTVDFSVTRDGNPSRVGFLHSINDTAPPDEVIRPLRPGLIRAADSTRTFQGGTTPLARSLDLAEVYNLVLSDSWGYPPNWVPPYEDLDGWRNLVRTTIEREDLVAAARAEPERVLFEPWNEPDVPIFWAGTEEQFFEVFHAAEQVIRDVYPDAVIAGPSIGFYNVEYIRTFLDLCLENGVRLDVLAFHAFQNDVVSLGDDIAEVRREFLENPRYSPLGIRGIVVNEYAFITHDLLPGENLGFLYLLEEGGVLRGARACWGDNCFNASLDGLLTPETKEPRAVWWAYRAYAAGVDSRVVSALTDRQIVAIASGEGLEAGAAQVLIGHIGVLVERPPTEITLTLRGLDALPGDDSCVELDVSRIPNAGEDPLTGPEPPYQLRREIESGQIRVTLPSPLPEHEVLILAVRRANCADGLLRSSEEWRSQT